MRNKKSKKSKGFGISIGLTFLSIAASFFALYQSCQSNELAKETIRFANHPNWKHALVFAENNLDLLRIDFFSPNESVLIQKIEIHLPSIVYPNQSIERFGNNWKATNLRTLVENALDSLDEFESKPEDETFNRLLGYEDCMPVAVTINYIQFGQARTVTNLYKLIFTVFPFPPIKIRILEFDSEIKGNLVDIAGYLDYLACSSCIMEFNCIDEVDILSLDSLLSDHIELKTLIELTLSNTVIPIEYRTDLNNRKLIRQDTITIPSFLFSIASLNEYRANIKSAQKVASEEFGEEIESIVDDMEYIFTKANYCAFENSECWNLNQDNFSKFSKVLQDKIVLLKVQLILWQKKSQIERIIRIDE